LHEDGKLPWEQDGYEPPKRREYPPGELLARARKRLALKWESIPRLVRVKIAPDRGSLPSMKSLKAARKKLQVAATVVRDEAFNDWIGRCVVSAERPDEWSQARDLYESYLRQAKSYGINRGDKRLAKEELATETQWGKMMGSLYPNKKRRRNGWYYPVRLKRGA
jgi:hypothetical protein